MNSHERFRTSFLSDLKQLDEDGRHVTTTALSLQYQIPEPYIRQLLLELVGDGLISIGAYDGHHVRQWDLWGTPEELFFNKTDNGHVRVKLLAKGAEYLEDHPRRPIGFTA